MQIINMSVPEVETFENQTVPKIDESAINRLKYL